MEYDFLDKSSPPGVKRLLQLSAVRKSSSTNYRLCGRLGGIMGHGIVELDCGAWAWLHNDLIQYMRDSNQLPDPHSLIQVVRQKKCSMIELMKYYAQLGMKLDVFVDTFTRMDVHAMPTTPDDTDNALAKVTRDYRGGTIYI